MPTELAAGHGAQSRRSRPLLSSTVLTVTALIWGLAFVAQRLGMESIGPFMFVSLRMFLGALTLGLVVVLIGVFQAARGRRGGAVVGGGADVTVGASGGAGVGGAGAATAAAVGASGGADVGGAGAAAAAAAGGSAASGSVGSGAANPPNAALPGQTPGWQMLKRLLASGTACGAVLFVAASLQQVGMVDTEASKAGFLTALYIVLVPILGIALRNKTHWNTWISVVLAVVGLYFLSIADSLTIQPGDAALLVGALFWACHILVIDRSVIGLSQAQVMRLCVVQFAVAAVLALLAAPFLDGFFSTGSFDFQALADALPTVLYVGVLSTGVAFTLQAIGQQGLNPSAASIIMSMEAVFSVFGGMLLLQETMTGREILGCVLMLAAVILSQLPIGRKSPTCQDGGP